LRIVYQEFRGLVQEFALSFSCEDTRLGELTVQETPEVKTMR
jgi:hypothetical protein